MLDTTQRVEFLSASLYMHLTALIFRCLVLRVAIDRYICGGWVRPATTADGTALPAELGRRDF